MEEGLNDIWGELKDVWKNSSQTEKIELQMSGLLTELKDKVSRFEKDSIRNDIKTIKASTSKVENNISQFEKDSIKRDIAIINKSIKKIIRFFKKKTE